MCATWCSTCWELWGFRGMAQTCGYFFLPDVNLANVADAKTQEYIKSNGFASMQELDYCMNLEVNGGSWDQDYGNGVEIHTKTPPVKLAHLITATNSAGAIFCGRLQLCHARSGGLRHGVPGSSQGVGGNRE